MELPTTAPTRGHEGGDGNPEKHTKDPNGRKRRSGGVWEETKKAQGRNPERQGGLREETAHRPLGNQSEARRHYVIHTLKYDQRIGIGAEEETSFT